MTNKTIHKCQITTLFRLYLFRVIEADSIMLTFFLIRFSQHLWLIHFLIGIVRYRREIFVFDLICVPIVD